MKMLKLLEGHIKDRTLNIYLPDGTGYRFGSGPPEATMRFHDRSALRRIAFDPDFELGQTYMDGAWDPGDEGLRNLLNVLMYSFKDMFKAQGLRPTGFIKRIIKQSNRIRSAYRNVSHHYDIDEWLFRRFLDKEMNYSCAYFERPEMSLEEAQEAKNRIIARKLCLEPGMRVLDIGCGWGGLALHLASEHGVHVDGFTLSEEQLRIARDKCSSRKLENLVEFYMRDYREHEDRYDRIVSVGMFEHVGQPYYHKFFKQLNHLLKDDGIALIHTIGRTGPPSEPNEWIQRYIFPGGYIPSLSEVMKAVEPTELKTTDVEVWRLHYAETLAEWFRRFEAVRDEVKQKFDDRFCRMWEFYLASCEGTFRHWEQVVFQIQVSKQHEAVPITRNYIYRP